MTTSTITTAQVAAEARALAVANGQTVGERGRVSTEVLVNLFLTRPKRAREVAKAVNLDVSKRGRLSVNDALAIATLVR